MTESIIPEIFYVEDCLKILSLFSTNWYVPYDEARLATKNMLESLQQLARYNEQLEEKLDQAREEITQLKHERHVTLRRKSRTDGLPSAPAMNTSELTKLIRNTITTEAAIREKSCIAVIEKVPERETINRLSSMTQNLYATWQLKSESMVTYVSGKCAAMERKPKVDIVLSKSTSAVKNLAIRSSTASVNLCLNSKKCP